MDSFPAVDTVLRLAGVIAAVLFIIYVILFFLRTTWQDGILSALLRLFSLRIIIPLIIVLIINMLVFSVAFIEPEEVGVVVSFPSAGGVRPEPLRGGVHFIIPFLEYISRYPIAWQTYTMSGSYDEGDRVGSDAIRARTSDGQEVLLSCSAIFRIDNRQVVLLHIEWQDRYKEEFVRPVIRSLVRRQVSQYTVEEVNSSARRDLENDLDRRIAEEFLDKGLVLDQFLLRDLTFSPEYAQAIERKQVALEEQARAEFEAERQRRLARGRSDAIIIEAQGQADALALIANELAENRDLLTYRYIDKLSGNIRVMLVPANSPLILPLEQMLGDTDMLTSTETLTGTDVLTPTTSVEQP